MHVVFAHHEPLSEGKARFVAIARTLVALAAQARVTWLAPDARSRIEDFCARELGLALPRGLEVRTLASLRGLGVTFNRLFLRGVRKTLPGLRGDVLHLRSDKLAAYLCERLPRPQRPPLVYEAHLVGPLWARDRGARPSQAARLEALERVVYTGSAGVAAISSGLLDEIRSRYGFGGPAAVVPSAADTSLFRPLWSGGDGRTVAYCGTLQFWKGVGALLEALALSPGLRLLLVGDGEETERKALHAAIERLGLRERVTLAGRVPQTRLPALLSSAACAVHPSTDKASIAARFTSPMKVVEALALGLPVVASDLPSTRELLRHEENALLAPPGDAQALARALERLCRDRALARRLSQAGRQTAQDMTYDARARKLLALFALAGA